MLMEILPLIGGGIFGALVKLLSIGMQNKVEMIPYRLIPSMDIECPIQIEIIHPISMLGVPVIYEDEFVEVIKERVVFEVTNPFAHNEIFSIDGKQYYLLRVPYTGVSWK